MLGYVLKPVSVICSYSRIRRDYLLKCCKSVLISPDFYPCFGRKYCLSKIKL